MCGICSIVNCIKRNLCGCGCRRSSGCARNNGCGYARNNGCGYREEPCMNVICANQETQNFTPCRDNDNCRCHRCSKCD